MAIGRVDPLGDDAFLPGIAHRRVELLARADDVVGDVDRRLCIGEQRFEPFLALDIGEPGKILAIEFEQVEGVEVQRVARSPARRGRA